MVLRSSDGRRRLYYSVLCIVSLHVKAVYTLYERTRVTSLSCRGISFLVGAGFLVALVP